MPLGSIYAGHWSMFGENVSQLIVVMLYFYVFLCILKIHTIMFVVYFMGFFMSIFNKKWFNLFIY